MGLLDKWGVIDALRSASGKLGEFLARLAEVTGYAQLVLIVKDIFNLGPDAEGEREGEPEGEVGEDPSSEGPRVRTRRFDLALGRSQIQVDAASRPNETVTGAIHKNRLADAGLVLKNATLQFDERDTLLGGQLHGQLALGNLGDLKDVNLDVTKSHIVTPRFDNATLEAKAALKESVATLPGRVSGTLSNTQTVVRKVEMSDQYRVILKMPDPVGGDKAEATEPADFILEKRHDEWLVVGRGFSFKGGYLTYELLEFEDGKDGVTLHGKAIAKLDMLGDAEGELQIVKSKFKQMDLRLRSKLIKQPAVDPVLVGHIKGALTIDGRGPSAASLDAMFQLQHASFNNGEPVTLAAGDEQSGMIKFDEQWRAHFNAKIVERSVAIIPDMVNLEDFQIKRDPEKGFSGQGKVILQLADDAGRATLTYNTPKFAMSVDGKIGPKAFQMTAFNADYNGKNWQVRGKASIGAIEQFERIDADFYYHKGLLGFSLQSFKASPVPGVPFTAGLKSIEYDLGNKTFNGEGFAGAVLPVVGTTQATFSVKKNKIKGLTLNVDTPVRLPSQNPVAIGNVRGELIYQRGSLEGSVDGKLDVVGAPGQQEPSTKKTGAKGRTPTPEIPPKAFEFELRATSSRVTGKLVQSGKVSLYDMFELSGLNLQLSEITDVRATAAKLSADLGDNPKNLKDFNTKLTQNGIELQKKSDLAGSGKMKASAGESLSGELDLKYANGAFQKSLGTLRVGAGKLDKKEGPGLAASVTFGYSSYEGLSLVRGEITANLAKGLQATGALEQEKGQDFTQGLNAELRMDGTLMDQQSFSKDIVPEIEHTAILATIPTPVGLVTAYGKIGAKLGFDFAAGPVDFKDGRAQLVGINLKERSFAKAYANLDLEGLLKAELRGGPSLGLGVSFFHPKIFGVEGDLKLGMAAKAESRPRLKTMVVYEKQPNRGSESIKPKAGAKLDVPFALGLEAYVEPTITIRALYDMLKYPWPIKKFGPVPLLEPKEIFRFSLDLGNMGQKSTEDLKKMVPAGANKMKAASPEAVEAVTKSGEETTEQSSENKQAEEPAERTYTAGPFSFSIAMGELKNNFDKNVRKPVKQKLKDVLQIAQKIKQLGGEALKNIKAKSTEAIEGISLWIKEAWHGKSKEALKNVKQATDLQDISYIGSLKKYWTELSTAQKVGASSLALVALGLLGLGAFTLFGKSNST